MRTNKNLFYTIVALLITSCFIACHPSYKPVAYMQYFENPKNKLIKEFTIGDLTYILRYHNNKYVTIRELGVQNLTKNKFDTLFQIKKNYIEFNLRIQSDLTPSYPLFKFITKDESGLVALNNYFISAKQDFTVKYNNGKEIAATTYFFQPNSGNVPYEEFTIGFSYPQDEMKDINTIEFKYDDKIFKHGPIYFTINQQELSKIPQLVI